MEASASVTAAAKQTIGRPFPKGASGNANGRPNIHARANELFDLLSADLGKPLSAIDETLLRQACLLLARAERVSRIKDADVGIRMAGEARRILAMLKRTAPKHTAESSLADLLQADHAESRAAADAVHIQHQNGGTTELAADAVEASATAVRAGRKDATSDDGKGAVKPLAMDAALPKTDAASLGMSEDEYRRLLAGEPI